MSTITRARFMIRTLDAQAPDTSLAPQHSAPDEPEHAERPRDRHDPAHVAGEVVDQREAPALARGAGGVHEYPQAGRVEEPHVGEVEHHGVVARTLRVEGGAQLVRRGGVDVPTDGQARTARGL